MNNKTSGVGAAVAARLLYGAFRYGSARADLERSKQQRLEAEMLNRTIENLQEMQMAPATGGMRHSPVPMFVTPEMGIPLGMSEGMVRLASALGRDAARASLEKRAGFGDVMRGASSGLQGLASKALSRGPSAIKAAPLSLGQRWNQATSSLGQKVEQRLTGMGKPGAPTIDPMKHYTPSGAPSGSVPSLAPPDVRNFAGGAPRTPLPQAPARSAAPQQSQPAVTQTPVHAPSNVQAPQPAAPQAPPAAAPQAPGSGTMDRLQKELGGGQWKTKLPTLLAAGGLGYAAYRGLKGGLNYLSHESTPYSFNQGGPQLAYGVNQYGTPQLGQ